MADELDRPSNDELDELDPQGEGTEPEPEDEELEDEGAGEGGELSEESAEDGERRNEDRTERRTPDTRQRDARRRRDEDFERAVERAVARRLPAQAPPRPDIAEQRRALDTRRRQELDEARMQGPEAYADVRDRHLREDYRADFQARETRDADDREQSRFERLCDRNPIYDNLRDDVEREVVRLKGLGVAAPNREVVAKVIFADRQMARANRAGNTQRRSAAETTRRQTVRNPTSSSGQQPAQRSRRGTSFADLSVEEMEAQLSHVPIRST